MIRPVLWIAAVLGSASGCGREPERPRYIPASSAGPAEPQGDRPGKAEGPFGTPRSIRMH